MNMQLIIIIIIIRCGLLLATCSRKTTSHIVPHKIMSLFINLSLTVHCRFTCALYCPSAMHTPRYNLLGCRLETIASLGMMSLFLWLGCHLHCH